MATHSSVLAWRIPAWWAAESDTTEVTQQQQQQCWVDKVQIDTYEMIMFMDTNIVEVA